MVNKAGEKVRDIIRKEFDESLAMAVVTYILDCGFEKLKGMTEEDVLKEGGFAFVPPEVCQAGLRAAVRICKECSQIGDFLPYIINYLYVPSAKMKKVEIHSGEMLFEEWEKLLDKFGLDYEDDYEDIKTVVLNANVIETKGF